MTTQPFSNGVGVKTSVNTRPKNRKTMIVLISVIVLILAISVTYIIIYPSL